MSIRKLAVLVPSLLLVFSIDAAPRDVSRFSSALYSRWGITSVGSLCIAAGAGTTFALLTRRLHKKQLILDRKIATGETPSRELFAEVERLELLRNFAASVAAVAGVLSLGAGGYALSQAKPANAETLSQTLQTPEGVQPVSVTGDRPISAIQNGQPRGGAVAAPVVDGENGVLPEPQKSRASHRSVPAGAPAGTPGASPARQTESLPALKDYLRDVRASTLPEGVCVKPGVNFATVYKKSDWLKQIFGKTEAELRIEYRKAYAGQPLPSYTLGEIDDLYNELFPADRSGQTSELKVGAEGTDVLKLMQSDSDDVAGGVVQVASRFTGLEGQDLTDYQSMMPQGQRASLAAADALFRRATAVEQGLYHAFSDPALALLKKHSEDGYLERMSSSQAHQMDDLLSDKNMLRKVRILPQWVQPENGSAPKLQVFVAAVPTRGALKNDPATNALAKRLAVAQYRATAQLAAIVAVQQGKKVPLHLTLLGQGVFGNPEDFLEESFKEVKAVLGKVGGAVPATIHGYNKMDQKKISKYLNR